MAKYSKSVVGMFTGEDTLVTLEAENHMVGNLIDRFGKDIDITPVDDAHFEVNVTVNVSPQFLGWIFALGQGIRITGPDEVVERMRNEIHRLSEQYQ
jgi:predicted DNA-binding transcriptional regulator YafY